MSGALPYEDIGLWRRALGETRRKDPNKNARIRLRASYETFWLNTKLLVERVSADFPSLTLHNEAHLAALWQTADTIAGTKYDLTPAEVFVFGGAILLHDAALTVYAYPGGRAELTATTDWRDAVAAEAERQRKPAITYEWDSLEPSVRDSALFAVVRKIHAKQAERMADFSITKDGTQYHLLEDNLLREHYGSIIGKIAASHHWPIEDVESRLQRQVNPIGDLPTDWTIDPVKLACLLRCADAAQIDQRRAPDFLYALLKLRGISEQHWRAQNRLAKPVPYKPDPTALLYTSTKPFQNADADVWWLVYDLVTIVHRELQSCDKLLRETARPPFAVKSVRDAEAPTRLTSHIEVEGWSPVIAEVKVSDLSHLVTTLGGQELYGDDPTVPLREMIQNASDAVRARRMRDKDFVGKIIIRLEPADAHSFWLRVEDDGIGMSERVLTGPLLDFGKSFWKSDLVEGEFPGLRSSGYESTGRFGIGFFSIFMIADAVHVTSHRYEAGSAAPRRLEFRKGLALRPILVTNFDPPLSSSISTQVSIHVSAKTLEQILTEPDSPFPGESKKATTIKFTLAQRIGRIAASLDVDVDVIDGRDQSQVRAHRRDWVAQEPTEWLRTILASSAFNHPDIERFVQETAKRMETIHEGNRVVGRAAIFVDPVSGDNQSSFFPEIFYKSLLTIGGLAAPRSFRSIVASIESSMDEANFEALTSAFVGVMNVTCEGAVRAAGKPLASQKTLSAWASRQGRLIADGTATPAMKVGAISRVRNFGGDAAPLCHLAMVSVAQLEREPHKSIPLDELKILSMDQMRDYLSGRDVAIFLCNKVKVGGIPPSPSEQTSNSPEDLKKDFIEGRLTFQMDTPPIYATGATTAVQEHRAENIFVSHSFDYRAIEFNRHLLWDPMKSPWLNCIATTWGGQPDFELIPVGPYYLLIFTRRPPVPA